MNVAHKLNIYMLPCLSIEQLENIEKWRENNGHFNEELYEKIRVIHQQKNVTVRQTGIRFNYDKNTQTLQASSLYIQRLDSHKTWCPRSEYKRANVS